MGGQRFETRDVASLTPAVPLRLARTHAAADRGARIAARTVAAGAAAFGLWQAIGVEDGALGTLAGLGLVCLAPSLARGRRRAHRLACALAVLTVLTTAAGTGTGPALWAAIAALTALAACGPAFGVVADPATRRTAIWASTAALAALVADVAHATGVLVHPLVAASLADRRAARRPLAPSVAPCAGDHGGAAAGRGPRHPLRRGQPGAVRAASRQALLLRPRRRRVRGLHGRRRRRRGLGRPGRAAGGVPGPAAGLRGRGPAARLDPGGPRA